MQHAASDAPDLPIRVLVVDADRRVRSSLELLISVADGFACVSCCAGPADAFAVLESQPVDAVLIDPRLPDVEIGLAFMEAAHHRWPHLALVAMSGSDDLAPATLRDGAIAFVGKSGQPDDLFAALTRGVQRRAIV
jgi:DNA-binding NtrC family response regulator